jgi:hypothetical protein
MESLKGRPRVEEDEYDRLAEYEAMVDDLFDAVDDDEDAVDDEDYDEEEE